MNRLRNSDRCAAEYYFSILKEKRFVICYKMDESWRHYAVENNSV
jgi:hypothetical protein